MFSSFTRKALNDAWIPLTKSVMMRYIERPHTWKDSPAFHLKHLFPSFYLDHCMTLEFSRQNQYNLRYSASIKEFWPILQHFSLNVNFPSFYAQNNWLHLNDSESSWQNLSWWAILWIRMNRYHQRILQHVIWNDGFVHFTPKSLHDAFRRSQTTFFDFQKGFMWIPITSKNCHTDCNFPTVTFQENQKTLCKRVI